MHWIQPITGGMTPTPRYGHVLCPTSNQSEVYIYGGLNEEFLFCPKTDLYLLYETSKQSDKNWRIVEDMDLGTELAKNLEKAEWEQELQKQKIAEVEECIKRVEEEREQVERGGVEGEGHRVAVEKEVGEESERWIGYLGNWEALRNRESRYCRKMKELVDCEHEYRKFFQQKCMMLTDIFKNMENLLINIDKAVV